MYDWMQGQLLANGADLLHPSEDDDPEFIDMADINYEMSEIERKKRESERLDNTSEFAHDEDDQGVYSEIVSIIDADSGKPIDFTVEELGVDLNTTDSSHNFSAGEVEREMNRLEHKYDRIASDKVQLINVLDVIGNQTLEQRATLKSLQKDLLDKKT